MWNDTDFPLALFITFRSKGTWLHGDERESVDRHNNVYGAPRIPPIKAWQKHNTELLSIDPLSLNAARRRSVRKGILETCLVRGWGLYAFNIRTNHVHSVVAYAGVKPGKVLHALKANATRQLRTDGVWIELCSPWADGGSKRRLWNERSVEAAVNYVLYGQGDDLPDFDNL